MIRTYKNLLLTLIVFMLAFSIRVYWIGQKQGFHVDEMFTRTIITGNKPLGDYLLNVGTKFTSGKSLKNFYFDKPQNTLIQDLKELRKDNYTDDAHPSLYYSVLRTGFNFIDNEPQNFIKLGCGLNLIFFIFSFFIMQKILIRLFGDNKLVPIGLAVAFLNTGTISMTLFIRPYELQMLAFVLISYIFLIFHNKLINNENICNYKDFLILIFSLTFVFLSGYFLVLYVAMLGVILLLNSGKNIKNTSALILSLIVSVLLTWFFYNGYFQMLHGQRFSDITGDKPIKITSRLIDFISYICNLTKFLYYGLIIFTFTCFIPFMKKSSFRGLCLFSCSIIWTFLVAMISPFPVLRYIAPAFPLLSLLLINIIEKVAGSIKQNILILITFLIYFLSAIFPLQNESADTLVFYKKHSFFLPFSGRLENLYKYNYPAIDTKIPVVILSDTKSWFAPLFIISELKDKQLYKILTTNKNFNTDILKKYPYKHFYLFVDKIVLNINNNNAELKYLGNYSRFKCYEVVFNY